MYAFGWQGGEPALMGLDFFRTVVRFQKQYGYPGASISNGLQTNGTLLTDAMAAFFTEYKFLLGVSLDGPAEIHDYYRKRMDGTGTHREVMRGIRALRRQGTEFNALTLVTQANVRRGKEVYRYLKEEGFFFHQYMPCVEYDVKGVPLPWSITGEEWGGNIQEVKGWEGFLTSPLYRKFGKQKLHTHSDCTNYPYLNFCYGDCLKHRFPARSTVALASAPGTKETADPHKFRRRHHTIGKNLLFP